MAPLKMSTSEYLVLGNILPYMSEETLETELLGALRWRENPAQM